MSDWFKKNVTGRGICAGLIALMVATVVVVFILAVLSDQNHANDRKRQVELVCIQQHLTCTGGNQ